jgi:hypothetical protein
MVTYTRDKMESAGGIRRGGRVQLMALANCTVSSANSLAWISPLPPPSNTHTDTEAAFQQESAVLTAITNKRIGRSQPSCIWSLLVNKLVNM